METIYFQWVASYKPDRISNLVLYELVVNKYEKGDKGSLFGKFQSLIDNQEYKLCAIFRDCLEFIGLNNEFKKWQSNETV